MWCQCWKLLAQTTSPPYVRHWGMRDGFIFEKWNLKKHWKYLCVQLPVGKFKVVDCSSVLIMLIYYLDVTHLLLMKIKAEWFSLQYVGRGQVHVHVCACVCIIKRGSYFTRHTSLLLFIPAIHKTRINVKSVFNAFIFHLFIYLC